MVFEGVKLYFTSVWRKIPFFPVKKKTVNLLQGGEL